MGTLPSQIHSSIALQLQAKNFQTTFLLTDQSATIILHSVWFMQTGSMMAIFQAVDGRDSNFGSALTGLIGKLGMIL